MEPDFVSKYNYEAFIPENFMPLMRFGESPPLGQKVTEYSLWHLDGSQTSLLEVVKSHHLTIIEFGSFT